ncbi:RNA polymerase sigma factor SigJ [Thalassomonas haliotis]|uniref:RNA polymerase sigma factor SigJ n=1 Tax=Thalassomonas haliotis TaxID=485448 RepID=A0ABY7VA52_9GAMM|nr:RNA polymerase sigma factor SigJ [Thalassomonas haliotis]WDE10170.1 RNA polymerase sigma factor SigJ [Thalassomonas haliotis]
MENEQEFAAHRDKLFGIAYRLTGSVSESEDIVQDAYIRWHTRCKGNLGNIDTPQAWLTTVTTRLSLDYLKSARHQRQSYLGPWLPEPLIENKQQPESVHELDQTVTMALMVLLDRLSPPQRAAYILHDLLGYAFDEIAAMLGASAVSCRKLASRSREKIRADAKNSLVSATQHQALVEAFFTAVRGADQQALLSLLSDDVIFHSDGGGKAAAALHILTGREEVVAWVAKVLMPAFKHVLASQGKRTIEWFNGSPGIVLWQQDKPVSAFSFTLDESGIRQIYALRNPDKLQLFSHASQ